MATSGSDATPMTSESKHTAIGPLAAEDVGTLVAAEARLTAVRRADLLATVNGWSFAACAVLTLGLGLAQWTLIPLGLGLLLVTRVELTSRSLLRVPDVRGLERLGLNQIGLFLIVAAYCAWRVWVGLQEPPASATPWLQPYLERAPPDIPEALDKLQRFVLFGIYGTLFVLSALYQGGCAVFYFAQRKTVRRYVEETPDWVRELQRALGAAR